MSAAREQKNLPLALAALGVVFGDIGTSPLYAYETALQSIPGGGAAAALGVASLILWSLILIVTVKYVLIVMRADYHKEGGVFALLALLQQGKSTHGMLKLPLYVLVLLFGAALLFGDGTITPAISVLSAVEGTEVIDPGFQRFVIPATVAILVALFAIQRLGSGRLGVVFGWVMLLWFITIGLIGLWWVVKVPEVLWALNPLRAIELVRQCGWQAMALMGCVVLAVTGVEALYADMGHFSRKAISLAWHCIALPGLFLNYLGQAALAVANPAAFETQNPFFLMVPAGWPVVAMVALATLATVIASQAMIAGVFSLTAQAQELSYFPKFLIMHTSRDERGQVYVPTVNWTLAAACVLLVLTFRSSDRLASAYGLAVVGTMVITTVSLALVMKRCWKWKAWQTGGIIGVLLMIEVPFLFSCLTKIPDGGYFPLLVAGFLFVVMLTWHRGRAIILEHMRSRPGSVEQLAKDLSHDSVLSMKGQLIFVTSNRHPRYAVARAYEMVRRGAALREQVVLLSLVSAMESDVNIPRSIEVKELSPRLWHVVAKHGYMQEPHAPEIIARAHEISGGKIRKSTDDTFFVLGREIIVEYVGNRMARWRRGLFGFLSRNVSYAPDYFYIPYNQISEFTWVMRA